MRRDPRSGFAETCELAIVPPAPCIDAKTQLKLRNAEPENYTNGSVQDRGIHIVTQQSAIRAEIPFNARPPGRGALRSGKDQAGHLSRNLHIAENKAEYGKLLVEGKTGLDLRILKKICCPIPGAMHRTFLDGIETRKIVAQISGGQRSNANKPILT
jgi:hypothetical protein